MTTFTLSYADTPPSLNRVAGGNSHWRWSTPKKRWQQIFADLLLVERVPRDTFTHVTARAVLTFPTRRTRDEDNHQALLCKSLADAIVQAGVLPDDAPEYFHFCETRFNPTPGSKLTVVTLDCTALEAVA